MGELGELLQYVVYPLIGDRPIGRNPDPDATGKSVSMRSELWGRLPAEILEKVLLFLPAEAQTRLQLVCRAWRSLLTSPGLREESTSRALAYHRLCLLWDEPEELAKADRPLKVDLSFIPAKFQRTSTSFLRDSCRPDCFGVYGSDVSWVWGTKQGGKLWLCLVNLERRTYIELPPLSAKQLRVEYVGKVVQETGGLSFRLTVLLLDRDAEVLFIVTYASKVGAWTTTRLTLAAQPDRFCYHATLHKDRRLQVIYAQDDDAIQPDSFWQLASFNIENVEAGDYHHLARGSLPQSHILSGYNVDRDRFLPHNRGIYCIRMSEEFGMSTTISVFSWTIMVSDNGTQGDEYFSNMVRVSVLTAEDMDPDMRDDCCVERVEIINDVILMLTTCSHGLRVLGYDVEKKSWRLLVF